MYRHFGKERTFNQNLQIASFLSFVAGLVNVAGFLSVQVLTTNVTGHFAYFVDEVFNANFTRGLLFLFFAVSFLLGAFISNVLVELMYLKNKRLIFVFPVLLESILLLSIALMGEDFLAANPRLIANSLLFAMGLQNSLVTKISGAVVRTTHLTGLFTDLGIDLSQMLFYRSKEQRHKLNLAVLLRLSIIFFFFTGGVCSRLLYSLWDIKVLILGVIVLLFGLLYDYFKFQILKRKRKKRRKPKLGIV